MPAALYQSNLAIISLSLILGILICDLTFDLSGDTVATAYYYYVHRSCKLPAKAFLPAAILLNSVALTQNLITDHGKWQHWVAGVSGTAMAVIFGFFVLPKLDYLSALVTSHSIADHLEEAAAAEEVIKNSHVVVSVLAIVVLLLQVSASRVVEGAASKKKAK